MDAHDLSTVALVLGVVLLVILIGSWQSAVSEKILRRWAEENGLLILAYRRCWIFRGPFTWTTTRSQDVYYVTVQDDNGRTRNGYVRCGSFWAGIFSDKAEVRWED